jgi:hypothetical protein
MVFALSHKKVIRKVEKIPEVTISATDKTSMQGKVFGFKRICKRQILCRK